MLIIPSSRVAAMEALNFVASEDDDTRPSDVTWLDFYGPSKHLLIDTKGATLYRKYIMLASGR